MTLNQYKTTIEIDKIYKEIDLLANKYANSQHSNIEVLEEINTKMELIYKLKSEI